MVLVWYNLQGWLQTTGYIEADTSYAFLVLGLERKSRVYVMDSVFWEAV